MALPLLSTTDTSADASPALVGLKTAVIVHGDSPCAQDAFVNENSEGWVVLLRAAVTAALLYDVTVNDIGALISLTPVSGKVAAAGEIAGPGGSPSTLTGAENDCPDAPSVTVIVAVRNPTLSTVTPNVMRQLAPTASG